MGTRINVLLDHDLIDNSDRESVLARLKYSTAALRVNDYWRSVDPFYRPRDKPKKWLEDPLVPIERQLHRYTGPGSLYLSITRRAAHIRTGGR